MAVSVKWRSYVGVVNMKDRMILVSLSDPAFWKLPCRYSFGFLNDDCKRTSQETWVMLEQTPSDLRGTGSRLLLQRPERILHRALHGFWKSS